MKAHPVLLILFSYPGHYVKKYFLTSFWHLGLLSLVKWPHVPLLLQLPE